MRTHEASCQGKHGYPNRGVAAEVASRMRRTKDRSRVGVYQCPVCHLWHIGGLGIIGRPRRLKPYDRVKERRFYAAA